MDTIIFFEKNTRTESRNRKWAKMEKSAENRQDVSFIYIRFWAKQIKYRAHSDTGYRITFGCTSWFDIRLNIYRRFLINPCDLRPFQSSRFLQVCLIRNKQNYDPCKNFQRIAIQLYVKTSINVEIFPDSFLLDSFSTRGLHRFAKKLDLRMRGDPLKRNESEILARPRYSSRVEQVK